MPADPNAHVRFKHIGWNADQLVVGVDNLGRSDGAEHVGYDGTDSGLDASTVQAAIDLLASGAGEFNAVYVPQERTISVVHLHVFKDGSSGSWSVELYRYARVGGATTRIGTITLAQGGGANLSGVAWTITEPIVPADHYLFIQPTAKMGGSPLARVDVHWDPIPVVLAS